MSTFEFDGFDAYSLDENLENGQGVTIEYDDGRRFTIHRAGGANKRFGQLLSARMKPLARKIETGTLPDETANRILAEVYAATVIIGWEGITSKGQPVPFTAENVVAFLLAMPEVFTAIRQDANNLANFRREATEIAAKN
ncbi:hypothetical protein [Chelatococcus asaccharovorans]|uniref:Tail assembly chaperone n=1 Tax=Chelatococcus asaccharovorans TaxID=28210 RepID=A0A2V3U442_9HYPH|nr:hypothetical protein [Chelatococcus asaccharovorans]MBS7702709.1 hypothetical protein [Chelatococcus asaccharovorans]PXW57002.1 hypothetical protein C7450_10739 [Chelatococcus asaccharovorans]